MDKDSLAPDASEYSKSGTDDATAGDPAFDPNTTTPEAQKKQAGPDGAGVCGFFARSHASRPKH